MALITSSCYGSLSTVSVNMSAVKQPTKFFNTFISSDSRGKMYGGLYHCPASFDDNNTKFFVLNKECVYFIPLYLKKYWAKYEQAKTKDGSTYDSCVEFGWDDKSKKPEGAKVEYIIAGYLWDEENNTIVKHTEDMEDNNITAGEPVLIYFRCKGIKCNCAWELVKRVNEMAKNLTPLSDDPTFEQNVVNPRRFLIKASIGQTDPIHNRRFKVFNFVPEKKLPDELVAKIIDASNNKYLDDFNKQFDKTDSVSQYKESNKDNNTTSQDYSVKVESVDVPDVGSDTTSNDVPDFNIDII